jgi:Trypsin
VAFPSTSSLVLVEAKSSNGAYRFGTGYLVTSNHVLTARHVLGEPGAALPAAVRVRQESTKRWLPAICQPAWSTDRVDAVLLELREAATDIGTITFGTTVGIGELGDWESTGYPGVAVERPDENGSKRYATSGLHGRWYAQGGQGQLADTPSRFLDLGVESPPTDWHGISGAPILVGDALIGIIASAPPDFENGRLHGVPIEHIIDSPGFVATTTDTPHSIPDDDLWYLVVRAENTSKNTKGLIDSTLKTFEGQRLGLSPLEFTNVTLAEVAIDINEELRSPGRWLRFVELLTLAPVAVVDVTKFEPAVMLALGVRAVCRRGVTITVTRDILSEAHLADLPFNIKEARLVSLSPNRPDGRDGKDVLIDTIRRGLAEQTASNDYLDLPAYESVRGRRPQTAPAGYADFLVLCSFSDQYEPHWSVMREAIAKSSPGHKAVRMLDISSPRLVGQALYEQIRWNEYCLVDWTGWRANVFFEVGVRLACSRYDPVMTIHGAGRYVSDDGAVTLPTQLDLLTSLFQPVAYIMSADGDVDNPELDAAFERHRSLLRNESVVVASGALPPGATYEIAATAYFWEQERLLERPDASLRRQIEARIGVDSQRVVGESDILFATNHNFSRALTDSMREDWLAAWFYARGRAGDDPSPHERSSLVELGEDVWQALSRSKDLVHGRVRDEIRGQLDEWEDDDF